MKDSLASELKAGRAVRCAPDARVTTKRGMQGVRRPTVLCSALALWAAAGLVAQVALGQSWQTVDDFQYVAGDDSDLTGMTKDASGAIYVCGWANDSVGNWHALIQKSADAGATWTIADDLSNPNGPGYTAMTSDAKGKLYAVGNDASSWFVRQSTDGGLSWSTVDNVTLSGGPTGITTDVSGNLYVVGETSINTSIVRKGTVGTGGFSWGTVDSVTHAQANGVMSTSSGLFVCGSQRVSGGRWMWTVRRSTDACATWTTVDAFSLGGSPANATALGTDGSGIYVVGYGTKSAKADWVVRRSTDGGATWVTLDDFHANGWAFAFTTDSQGNHYVGGTANGDWLVRKNPANTTTWTTVDDFLYAGGSYSQVSALLVGASDNIFAAGYGGSGQFSNDHWIVRKQ